MLNVEQFKARISAFYIDKFYGKKIKNDDIYIFLKRQIPAYFDNSDYENAVRYICKMLSF